MNADHEKLKQILAEAAAKATPAERAACLDAACAGDAQLRAEVEKLLQAHERAGDFLEQPAMPPPPQPTVVLSTPLSEKPGDRIGRYKLLQQIGEGGCGVVYMAEQEEPIRRRVALKVIKLGMDTKQVIARFEAERQALALMDHPNIAKVLDAGATDTGRPYFVMELVRGIRITDYCDQNNLPTEARLDLFIQVCHAIQHAHQKGIIHRDIKPSNILVTISDPGSLGVPKIIDFGIAKATSGQLLTDKTLFTAFEQFIGTPAYMSPEQAEMTSLDIDTRSDIYALGVLLYELLTGQTPFDAKELAAAGLNEMRRIIREQEPVRPSTRISTLDAADQTTVANRRQSEPPQLIHLVRGDLDWIVMKALEKDRSRRYETANGLADDILCYLHNEPVTARSPSRAYRFQKLVRRNKLVFAAAAAVTAALVIGLGLSTWLFFKERDARQRAVAAEQAQSRLRQQAEADEQKAKAEANKSQQVAQFLKDMLQGVGPSVALGRDTTMLREILDKTGERVGKDLKDQPEVEAELRSTIGNVYHELGQYAKAEAMHRQALALRRKLFGDEHWQVTSSINYLVQALTGGQKFDEAATLLREVLPIQRKLFGEEDGNVAWSLSSLALVLRAQGKFAEAETLHREALAMRRKVLGNESLDVAWSLSNLAELLCAEGKRAEAEPLAREALAMFRKLLGEEHPCVADSLCNLANALLGQEGKLPEAETRFREALAMQRKLFGDEHQQVARSLSSLANVLSMEGQNADAEALHRQALAMRRKLLGNESLDVAWSLSNLAGLLCGEGKPAEAESLEREALTIRRKALGNEHPQVADSLCNLAMALDQQGRSAEAETTLREALALQRKLVGSEHRDVACTLHKLGDVLRDSGRWTEAEEAFRETVAMRRKLFGNEHLDVATSLSGLSLVLRKQGKLAEAETTAREALAIRKKLLGNEHADVAHSLHLLAWNLNMQGKHTEAEALSREELAMRRKLLGNEHPDVAWTLWDLTIFLRDQGKLPEAETTARESLSIRRKRLGNDHPDVAASFNLLSDLLRAQGKLAEVEQVCREALEAYSKTQGIGGDGYTRVPQSLAQLLKSENKLAEAEALPKDLLSQQRQPPGEQHVVVALALLQLANVLKTQNKADEAVNRFREALEIASNLRADATNASSFNDVSWRLATVEEPTSWDAAVAVEIAQKAVAGSQRKDPNILDTLAAAYAAAGQFTNAVNVQKEAIALLKNEEAKKDYASRLKLYESNLPYRDPDRLAESVTALLEKEKFAEAEPLARACLAIREKQIPDAWQTFNARSMLGGSLLGQKKYAEAEPLLLSGYEGMKQREDKIPADGKLRLKESLQRLVQFYDAAGRADKAAEWKQKLAEFGKTETEKKVAAPKP